MRAKRYESRVKLVEAMRLTAQNAGDVEEWSQGMVSVDDDGLSACARTPDGLVPVEFGDWIVHDLNGKFRVYTHRAFVGAYVEAE